MTKKQRLSFYKELLRIVCEDHETDFGFCHYISREMGDWYRSNSVKPIWAYHCDDFQKNLPELYAMKPKNSDESYWFPCTKEGWQQRIDKLHSLIVKMKNK